MKHFRMLAAGLCSAVLLCGSAIPAYAYSDSGNEEPPVVEETPAPEPAPTITQNASVRIANYTIMIQIIPDYITTFAHRTSGSHLTYITCIFLTTFCLIV